MVAYMNTKSVAADTLIYVVNFDGGGFALVSYSREYPAVPAGCVAVVVAQAMAVYSYPDIIDLTFEGAPSSTCELDWTGMINDYFDGWPACDYCFQKAALLREIGERVGMAYAPGGSGAYIVNVVPALASFGYESSPVYNGFSNDNVISSIDAGAPVVIEGRSSSGVGHEWIIDGYRYLKVKNQFFRKTLSGQLWTMQYYIDNDYYYLHMNFGHGTDKGYFLSLHHAKSGGDIAYSIDADVVSVFSGTGWDDNLKYICNIKLSES